MVVKFMPNVKEQEVKQVEKLLKQGGLSSRRAFGKIDKLLSIIGDESKFPTESIESFPFVEYVHPVQHSEYKLASRFSRHEYRDNTKCKIVNVSGVEIGNGFFVKIAGPCAVQTRKQMLEHARQLSDEGVVDILRGGAYKPRKSVYSFQGLHEEGLEYLAFAGQKIKKPTISEVTSPLQLPLFEQYGISILQIGANNMKNFELLKEIGNFAAKTHKAVMLKSYPHLKSYKEMLASAEYLLHEGCFDIIFCERGLGVSTGDYRNAPNLGLVHDLRKFSYFPIIVDPSHASGIDTQVFSTLDAYLTQNPHGFMIEVRRNNEKPIDECGNEVCDFKQSLTHNAYKREIMARRL